VSVVNVSGDESVCRGLYLDIVFQNCIIYY